MKTCLLLSLLLFCSLSVTYGQKQPNIVIILVDDLGQGDLKAFNANSKIVTPNLDKLAGQGMAFNDAHSGSAVCTPTRYGLLTGRYSFRSPMKSGVLQGYSPPLLEPNQATIATIAKAAGYTTACFGKWHLGLNWNRKDTAKPLLASGPQNYTSNNADYTKPVTGVAEAGFDQSVVLPASLDMPPYCFIRNGSVETPEMEPIEGHDQTVREIFYRTGYISKGLKMTSFLPRFVAESVSFIEKNKDKPFLLYVPLTAPHTPWAIEESFRGKSKVGVYGDFVQQTDFYVGQVLAALDKYNLSQNTIVIFASDNGSSWREEDKQRTGHLANNNWRGMKADIFEAGHRVPMLVRWPGKISPGSKSSATVCLTDVLATLADITGQKIPTGAGEDSYSLLPLFSAKTTSGFKRPYTIHHSADGKFAIRQGDWKYVSSLGSGGFTLPKTIQPGPGEPTGQLYNLATDPAEKTNLFAQQPDKVAVLSALLKPYETVGTIAAKK